MNPFSSDRFFNDAFFTEPVTIDGAEYAAVTSNIDELKTEGKIASKTGQWLKVAIPRSALANLPCRGGKLKRGARSTVSKTLSYPAILSGCPALPVKGL